MHVWSTWLCSRDQRTGFVKQTVMDERIEGSRQCMQAFVKCVTAVRTPPEGLSSLSEHSVTHPNHRTTAPISKSSKFSISHNKTKMKWILHCEIRGRHQDWNPTGHNKKVWLIERLLLSQGSGHRTINYHKCAALPDMITAFIRSSLITAQLGPWWFKWFC